MATLSNTLPTYLDWAKSVGPNGKAGKMINLLAQTNQIMMEATVKEGNLPTGEQTEIVTGQPTSYYRLINQGVPSSTASMVQITEQCANLENRSEVDKDVAQLNGDVNAFRASRRSLAMESMNQRNATTTFYGSAANPEEFVGFANRYNDLSAGNGQNILDAGGTGSDNSSIWLVGWSPETVTYIYPKGSTAGLQHEDLGLGDAFDSSNNRYRAYMERMEWKNGLVVKDWRYACRIANIDISDLIAQSGTQATTASTVITKMMSRAIDRLPTIDNVNPAFYCNRTVLSHLRILALSSTSSVLSIEAGLNQFGKTIHTLRFLGIPVRLVDVLTETEAQVV